MAFRPRRMKDFTTIAVNPADRERIRRLGEVRGDRNTRETVRYLLDETEAVSNKSQFSDNAEIIVERC